MSQSQGIEVRRPSRRTIATGAAWAVPVLAVGAAAPMAAASNTPCEPTFTVDLEGSFKCCDGGSKKNMKLKVKVTDTNDCLEDGSDVVCVSDVKLGNGQKIGQVVFEGGKKCVGVGGTFTVYLLDVNSCTVNLLVDFSINGGGTQTVPLQSGNISSGNSAAACVPPK